MFWASCLTTHAHICGRHRALRPCSPPTPPHPTPGLSQSRRGSEAVGGCRRPLHRWLQVQRHAWLITKGLQSSGRHSSPFLPRAGGGESRPGDGLWPSKESAGVEMSRFMLDYFSPSAYVHPSYLSFLHSVAAKVRLLKVLICHHVVSTCFQYPDVYGKLFQCCCSRLEPGFYELLKR